MTEAYAGAPDSEQYSYQPPVQMAHIEQREPKHELIDNVITVFGATPVFTACLIGFFIMGRATLKKLGLLK